jgi:hypothetical protein
VKTAAALVFVGLAPVLVGIIWFIRFNRWSQSPAHWLLYCLPLSTTFDHILLAIGCLSIGIFKKGTLVTFGLAFGTVMKRAARKARAENGLRTGVYQFGSALLQFGTSSVLGLRFCFDFEPAVLQSRADVAGSTGVGLSCGPSAVAVGVFKPVCALAKRNVGIGSGAVSGQLPRRNLPGGMHSGCRHEPDHAGFNQSL